MLLVPPLGSLIRKALDAWSRDHAPRLAAAIAFYAMLALAPLLVLGVAFAGPLLGGEEVRRQLLNHAATQLGRPSAEFLQSLLGQTALSGTNVLASIVSIIFALYGATNLFGQLSESVNFIWGVKHPIGIRSFLVSKLTALLMFLAFAVVLVVWLAIDAWLGWAQSRSAGTGGWQVVSFMSSTLFFSLVFAASFRALPARAVTWRDVGWAAAITGLGFAASKFLLSLYFAFSGVSAAYGAAGALVVLLLWVYYNAQLYFFGIELTCTYAHMYGSQVNRIEGQEPIRHG